jgi:hypothetical protein
MNKHKSAKIISLRKRRLKVARNTVRVHRLYRLEGEFALALLLRFIDRLQANLDIAVRELRELRQRKRAA